MKIAGQNPGAPENEIIVIPRKDINIIFIAQPVLDYEEFETLCPEPHAPQKRVPGGSFIRDVTDPGYKKDVEARASRQSIWMMFKSLEPTENLTWDVLDPTNPETLTQKNFEKEFRDAGFLPFELNRIVAGIMAANGLDESRVEEARTSFLATQQADNEQ